MTIKQYGGVFGRNPTFNDVTIEGQLTFDGDIDINSDLKVSGDIETTGNVIIATSGQGIDFSATSDAPGATSELLDDYEEGTWTPTPQNYDATSTVEGYYTKIGNMVYASFYIELDGTADGSTYSVLLPFVSANVTNALFGGAISFSTSIATGLTFRVRDFATEFRAYNSSGTELNYNQVGAASTVSGTIIYRAG